jgi:hypothetical protein
MQKSQTSVRLPQLLLPKTFLVGANKLRVRDWTDASQNVFKGRAQHIRWAIQIAFLARLLEGGSLSL